MNINQPVFICGALRSGSTLLHLMLDHHPAVKNPGEFDFLFDSIQNEDSFPDINDYHEFLDKSRIFNSQNLAVDASLDFPSLLHSFISQLSDKDHVLALNVHRNFHRIPAVFPDAKYIHLLRDPRDVARSSIEMGWRGNVYYGVEHWVATELSWNVLEKKLRPEQFTTLYYEKLIENPETVLNDICSFLGIPYHDGMLNYPLYSSYKKPDITLIQQWKRKLSEREIQYVEAKAGKLMEPRLYPLSGLPPIQIGLIEKLKLAIQNKIYRVKFGIKRYGVSLYTIEKATKLLGLEKINTKYFLMKEEINKQHLR